MHPTLLLILSLFGCTLVVPLFVLGATAGNWREALRAWKQFCIVLGALAAPAVVVGLVGLMQHL